MAKTNNTKGTQVHGKEKLLEMLKTPAGRQRFLENVFRTEAPDGPGTTDNEYSEIRITDYCAKAHRTYDPTVQVTVGDFAALGRDYARKVLAGIESTEVTDDGERFSWYSSEKYSPHICFEVDNDTIIHHEDCGWFLSPVEYYSAKRVLPHLELETHGDNDGALVAWGKYRADGSIFHPTTAASATDILLIVPWGGAHSRSRGCEDAQTKYFEKTVSKKGGKGYDFYILDVDDVDGFGLRNALIVTEHELNVRHINETLMFNAKITEIERLNEEYEMFNRRLDEVNSALFELDQQLHECPVASKSYVETLDFQGALAEINPQRPPCTVDMGIEELQEYSISDEEWHYLFTLVEKSKVATAAWMRFAPRYDRLYELITQTCRGWIEIGEDSVYVWLPSIDPTDEQPTHEYAFAFSESHLQRCIKLVTSFIASEESLAATNNKDLDGIAPKKK